MEYGQLTAPVQEQTKQEEAKKGISGSTIKIIAIVSMLIDHMAAALLTRILIQRGLFEISMQGMEQQLSWLAENALLYYGMMVMRFIGRLGFPIFCFLLVEGFQKTHNVGKYAFRLGIFALISEIPFDLAFSGKVLEFGYQNVYFTLLIGILALWAFDFFEKHDFRKEIQIVLTVAGILLLPGYLAIFAGNMVYGVMNSLTAMGVIRLMPDQSTRLAIWVALYLVFLVAMTVFYAIYRHVKGNDKAWRMCADLGTLAVAMFLADNLHTDYSGMGVLTIAMMYVFRRRKVISMLAGCIVLTLMSFSEITAFFALIPIALYNGKRGLKMKYFFYAFYPVHLLLIWLVALMMGMGWISVIG